MNLAELFSALCGLGVIVTDGHFVLASGQHSATYFNKNAIFPHPEICRVIGVEIARHFEKDSFNCVVGPAMGGVILAQWVAYSSGTLAYFAEKNDASFFSFGRGYSEHIAGRRVLVVEDVLTSGNSANAVIEAVQKAGGEVIGLGALCNRGGVTSESLGGIPLFSLYSLSIESWPEQNCPLCAEGVPINDRLGHAAAFLARIETQ